MRRLKRAGAKLQGLGARRQTQPEQFQYVVDVAINFQSLVSDALQAAYGRSDIFTENNALRLATQAINRGEAFANAIDTHGHVFQFQPKEDCTTNRIASLTISGEKQIAVRTVGDHPDIEDLTHDSVLVSGPCEENILDWIDELHRNSRGFELGTFDAHILGVTLKQQAANWEDIALGYISDIIALVHHFIVDVLKRVAPSRRVSEGIKSMLLDELTNMYRKAIDHTKFLLGIELSGTPATYNSLFHESLNQGYVKCLCMEQY